MAYFTRPSSRLISLPSALLLIALTGVWLSPKLAWASPEVATPTSCDTMTLAHEVDPQTTLFPYDLTISKNNVAPGETVEVRLASKTVSGPFMGFLAVGRTSGQETTPQGRFISEISSGEPKAKLTTCLEVENASATHISNTLKDEVILEWESPQVGGQYAIVVTVVKDRETFWVAEPSELITVISDESTPPPISEGLAGVYEDCGDSKGCFGFGTRGCMASLNCEIIVTYRSQEDQKVIQIAGRQTGVTDTRYVAAGLSSDSLMGEDHVFGCRLENGRVVVNEYYNQPDYQGNQGITRERPIISNPIGSTVDGYILCSFSVSNTYSVVYNGRTLNYDLESDAYFLLLARGSTSSIDELGGHPHANDRSASSVSIRLSDTGLLGARSTIYIQLHGAFMILAWLLCASSGMFTARYYKQTHTRIQPMGLAIWFWVHRVCMTLTLLFTIAGFILIFVEVGGYTSWSGGNAEKSHPILGIILTVLAVLQVCLALVRPAAGHTKRPLFNWVHWGAGNAAHIFGIACIYLANDLVKANLEQTRYWGVITGFICYHITLHIALTVHTFQVDKKMQIQEKTRAFTVGPMPPAGVSGEAPGTDIRAVILAAYILGATVTAICLIYFVVDALHT